MCRGSHWRAETGSSCASSRWIGNSTWNTRGASSNRSGPRRSPPLLTDERTTTAAFFAISAVIVVISSGGCRQDMHDQPKFTPFRASTFFVDQQSARPFVPGTVARGQLKEDELLHTGKTNGKDVNVFPFAIDQ